MANHDGRVVLVFNGEIYNHAEIRRELETMGRFTWKTHHSDTEVILHAYEAWGLECIHRFKGMFAIAIYDVREPERPQLHLIRDRVGVKPLYFARTTKGEWLFASEVRALFPHPDMTKEMDRTAFWHYLTFIVTPAPLTLFRGVFKLPAGYVLTIDADGRAHHKSYWDCRPDLDHLRASDLSEAEAVSELTRLLKQSIERRMVSDVPFGVLLSGGVDSSMNVALMSELMNRPVTTFTIGYEGEEQTNEFNFARQISARYKTDHHEMLINEKDAQEFLPLLVRLQDEPIADNVCIPLYFLAKLVKQSGTTVVQVGEGADENFLGYWWCEHYRQKSADIYEPIRQQQKSMWWKKLLFRAKAELPGLSGEDLEIQHRAQAGQQLFWGGAVCWWGAMRQQLTPNAEPFRQSLSCPVDGLLPPSFNALDSHAVVQHYLGSLSGPQGDILRKIPYMEMKLRLPEHLLMRVDKLTMAHSIEARVPFLDHDLVEFATRMPVQYKLREGLGKAVLKKAAEPYLDKEIIYRKKQGFGAPMERWFKDPQFGNRCVAAFERSPLRKEGFINGDYFMGLLRQQMGASGGYSFHLWTVLNAILWYESWIEGREDCF